MFFLRAWPRSSSRNSGANRVASSRSRLRRHRPQLEALEDRITPAFNLTISTDPTVGVALTNGVFTATASGANINVAAILFELNIGNNVTITNGTGGGEAGNITWLAGANLTVNGFAARSLVITADATSTNGAINLQSQVSTTTTLNQAYNAQGDLVVAAALRAGAGTMLLVSTAGSVSENSGAAV